MLAVFIHLMEVALFSLICILIHRVRSLYLASLETSPKASNFNVKKLLHGTTVKNADYDNKMDCLKKAQVFSASQLLEIKRSYGEINQKEMSWLREAISLYLIGAIDYIGKSANCGAQNRKELITLVLKSNLKLSTENSVNYFNEALYRQQSSDNDLMVRAGAKAARSWLKEKEVPKNISLMSQLDDWGIFA